MVQNGYNKGVDAVRWPIIMIPEDADIKKAHKYLFRIPCPNIG